MFKLIFKYTTPQKELHFSTEEELEWAFIQFAGARCHKYTDRVDYEVVKEIYGDQGKLIGKHVEVNSIYIEEIIDIPLLYKRKR